MVSRRMPGPRKIATLAVPGASLEGRAILQIIPRLDSGGAERTTLDIAAALVDAGARALVASEGGRLVAELQARGGVFVPFPAATKNPLLMPGAARKLRALIEAERVDLVHVRSRAPAWVALGVCRSLGVPFVTTWHGAYSAGSGVKTRYNSVMARGDAVIANSAFTAGLVLQSAPEAGPRVVTIPRGVDMRAFLADAVEPDRIRRLRAAWRVAPDERIVLTPARLARRKGHLIMVEAARRLADQGFSDLVHVFAGDSDGHETIRADIERAAAAAGLGDRVRCVGHWPDMPAAYLASAVAVAPSVEAESFGRVAVEAQAVGVPVVVADLGAARETVRAPPEAPAAERTGWRVKAGDPAALAEGLAQALSLGAAGREALARRARAHVAPRFSVERMASSTLDVYARLFAARSAAGAH